MSAVKLRGNTFLLLLLRSSTTELSAIDGWQKAGKDITKPKMFLELLRFADPTHCPNEGTLAQYFSQFLSGKRPFSKHHPFDQPAFRAKMQMRMENEYDELLKEMDAFCKKYLDYKNNNSMKLLIAGIIEAIESDETIGDEAKFSTGHETISKKEIKKYNNYILQSFLLSVWDYIVENKPDAGEATDTYTQWTKDGGCNSPRLIITEIGAMTANRLSISTDISEASRVKDIEETNESAKEKGKIEAEFTDNENKEDGPKITSSADGIHQILNIWNNAPGGIQAEHIENLVLPESWGKKYEK